MLTIKRFDVELLNLSYLLVLEPEEDFNMNKISCYEIRWRSHYSSFVWTNLDKYIFKLLKLLSVTQEHFSIKPREIFHRAILTSLNII